MSKINPLVILGAFILIFLIVFFKVGNTRALINENSEALASLENNAIRLFDMKKIWNLENSEAKLRTIFQNHKNLDLKIISNKIVLNSSEISKNIAKDTIGKVLNDSFNIQSLKIIRNNDENISISLEVLK